MNDNAALFLIVAVLTIGLGGGILSSPHTRQVLRARLAQLWCFKSFGVLLMICIVIAGLSVNVIGVTKPKHEKGIVSAIASLDCFVSSTMFGISIWLAQENNQLNEVWTIASYTCLLVIACVKLGHLFASFMGKYHFEIAAAVNICYGICAPLIPFAKRVFGQRQHGAEAGALEARGEAV